MPTIREIFGRHVYFNDKYIPVRDRKIKQCSHISPSDEHPFVKRCTKNKMSGLEVCKDHAYTVNYMQNGIERTAYFSTIPKAEYFKVITPSWMECNYSV